MIGFATNPIDGTRIAYEVVGAGSPLILLHGFSCNRSWWRHAGYVDALADHFQLILIDCRGHGESDKPRATEAYEADLTTADTLAIMDRLGIERATFMGYSMGGEFAFELAAHHPGRVRSLVLLSAHPFGARERDVDSYLNWSSSFRDGGIDWWLDKAKKMFGDYPDWCAREWLSEDANALAGQAAAFGRAADVSEAVRFAQLPMIQIAGSVEPAIDVYRTASEFGKPGRLIELPELNHLEVFLRSDLVLEHLRGFHETGVCIYMPHIRATMIINIAKS